MIVRAESIGYLFGEKELAALMLLADVSRLPGIGLGDFSKEDIQAGLSLLDKARLIDRVDTTWIVNRPLSLVMRAMGLCDWFFSARSGGFWAAFYTGQGIFVSARTCAVGRFVVTPFPDGDKAWADILCYLPTGELNLILGQRYKVIKRLAESKEELSAITYEELERQAATNSMVEMRENLWKA